MANEKRLIDANKLNVCYINTGTVMFPKIEAFVRADDIADAPIVDAVVLPCKVGDTVYTNCAMRGWYYRDKDRPYSTKVVFMGLNNSEEMGGGLINVVYEKNDNMMQFKFSDIGKTVFLTSEEAKAALAKMDGDGNG